MQNASRIAHRGTAILGVIAAAALLLAYAPLEFLRPKMVAFEPLSATEQGLFNFLGVALLLALAFCVLAMALLIRHMWMSQRLSLFYLLVIGGGVLTPILIFGDIALISDIGNQYESGLSQPEWTVLYIVLGFQLLAIAALLYAVFTLDADKRPQVIVRDANQYLITHYVGALCGLLGFLFTLINFRYPRPLWMVQQQLLPTLIVMLAPYLLMILFWLLVSSRKRGWLDEKQRCDIGASAVVAGFVSLLGMTVLYALSFTPTPNMVSVLWYSYYVFLSITTFSLSNLYLSRDHLRLPE